MLTLSLFHNFPNRISRSQWWLGMIVIGAIVSGTIAVGGQNPLLLLGSILLSIAIFAEITISRLNDRNRCAMTALFCLMVVGTLTGLIPAGELKWWTAAALWISFAAWAVIELGVLRGTRGSNPYGPDPLDEPRRIKRHT